MARDAWRGERRIRVTLEVGAGSARVTGLQSLDGPAVQRPTLDGTHVVQVLVGGATALLQAIDDPLLVRGIAPRGERGHSFERVERAVIHVDVPLPRGEPAGEITIRITDVSGLDRRPIAASDFDTLASVRDAKVRLVAEVSATDLAAHPAWATLGLGGAASAGATGGFEIYVDREGRYRWRLRRPDGQIVADSGQGYAERQACETDLRWIREHGTTSPVRPLDLP